MASASLGILEKEAGDVKAMPEEGAIVPVPSKHVWDVFSSRTLVQTNHYTT